MARRTGRPTQEALVAELSRLRRAGITRLRSVDLPGLRYLAIEVLDDDSPSAIERLLRQSIQGLGGGQFGQAALLLFGLAQATRGVAPTELRAMAADEFGVLPSTFRKDRERRIIEAVAQQFVGLLVLKEVNIGVGSQDRDPEARRQRLDRLVTEIAELSTTELAELIPILVQRLGIPQEKVWR